MPRGEGQQGKRRGKYSSREPATPVPGGWTDDDRKLYSSLVADSPLTSVATKEGAARRAVEADRQCRALDGMVRTADDDANLTKAQTQFRKALELLKVADRVKDDEEEL